MKAGKPPSRAVPKKLRDRARQAIANERLRGAIVAATDRYQSGRISALADLPGAAERRERLAEARGRALQHLPEYLDRLTSNIEARGGHTHRAADAAEACRIVREIAATHGVRRVVKSKSMVTEEIGLNRSLEAEGIRVVETDLGEYIIQLAGEAPSHIVGPAIHKTREDVSALFSEHLGTPPTTDIAELTAIARRTLRQEFLAADMGISGGNIAVADPGFVAIFTNEGNGRFVSSLPKVYVAITGIEKILGTMDEFIDLLELLPPNATGQKITTYVSLTFGPAAKGSRDSQESPDGPAAADGPDEFHLILLDNGRSAALTGPHSETLRCVRCGACINVCPVYRAIGGHAYGWVYPGPLGVLLAPMYRGLRAAREMPYACTLCGACKEVCPAKIDHPSLILRRRAELAEAGLAPFGQKPVVRAFGAVTGSPGAYNLATRTAALLQRPFVDAKRKVFRRLPYPVLGRWTAEKDFPRLARLPFRVQAARARKPGTKDGDKP